MAISFIKTPPTVVPAKNQCEIEVATDAYVTVAGVKAEVVIEFPTSPTTGTLDLSNSLKSQIFTFEVTPDTSGTQLPRNTGALSAAAYCTGVLVPALLNNFYLRRDYNIAYLSDTGTHFRIKFTAINSDSAYSLTVATSVTGVSQISNTAGVNKAVQPNFKVLIDLFAEKTFLAKDDELAFSGEGLPDANNKASWNLQTILEAITGYVIPNFTTPIFWVSNGAKRFYCKFLEVYGTPAVPHKYYRYPTTETEYLTAFHGASENTKYPFTNYSSGYYKTAMVSGTIIVDKKQKQYLTCLYGGSNPDAQPITVFGKMYYTDGTDSGAHVMWETYAHGGAYKDKYVTTNVGYTELGLDARKAVGKEILSYDVVISRNFQGGTGGGRLFNFKVEQNPQRYPRYFLFINSYGFPETVYLYGVQSRAIELDTTTVQRDKLSVDSENGIVNGEFDETNIDFRRGFEINTGNKDKAHIDYYTDFISSPCRYEQRTAQWVKLTQEKATIEMDKDDDTLFALKLKFKEAMLERGIA